MKVRRPLWLVAGLALGVAVMLISAATRDVRPRVASQGVPLYASRAEACVAELSASQRTAPYESSVDIVGRDRWSCKSPLRRTFDVVKVASASGDSREGGFIEADMLESAPPVRPIDYVVFMLALLAMPTIVGGSKLERTTAEAAAGYDGRFAVPGLPLKADRIRVVVGIGTTALLFEVVSHGPILRGAFSLHYALTVAFALVALALIARTFAAPLEASTATTAQGGE